MLHLFVKLFLFISLIYVLQNFNHGTHYNPSNCPQNVKSRSDFIMGRQLAHFHGHHHGHGHHGVHNHCTDTFGGTCRTGDPTSINKYKRDPSYDFPFDRPKNRNRFFNFFSHFLHTPMVVDPGYGMVPGVMHDPMMAGMGHPAYPPLTGYVGFGSRYIAPMIASFMGLPYYGKGLVAFFLLLIPVIIILGIVAAVVGDIIQKMVYCIYQNEKYD
ncbi:Uncharacterized protein PCOAH_00031870 [Plasmodium coatneyi]|uniref:Uncharacterized protein n=1 Tax=Plasmodium coatneyi TaxID=208452 RepID=A0A1B1E2S2_9APIC|nr:Uncharacterized protein PCOAH_00031870 [Plasmodium coatneyi]ANQ09200.1 Uncharacterized protein PCOAH_00031870 [Plasmodium coatneyi]